MFRVILDRTINCIVFHIACNSTKLLSHSGYIKRISIYGSYLLQTYGTRTKNSNSIPCVFPNTCLFSWNIIHQNSENSAVYQTITFVLNLRFHERPLLSFLLETRSPPGEYRDFPSNVSLTSGVKLSEFHREVRELRYNAEFR